MNNVIILLDDISDWQPYYKTSSTLTTSDYLRRKSFGKEPVLVINLSGDQSSNSEGYYCSLLAQARGHRVIPSGEIINKLDNGPGIRLSNGLQKLCQQWAQKNGIREGEGWYFTIYFGQCREKGLERVARFIFDNFSAPILRIKMIRGQTVQVESIQSIPLQGLSEDEQDCFATRPGRLQQENLAHAQVDPAYPLQPGHPARPQRKAAAEQQKGPLEISGYREKDGYPRGTGH